MNAYRVFEYKRGDAYSCRVTINEAIGSCSFSDIKFPDNTPQDVKEAFLEEAEAAALLEVERNFFHGA
jgi:hypothetical protein